jgi:hypothetical protein
VVRPDAALVCRYCGHEFQPAALGAKGEGAEMSGELEKPVKAPPPAYPYPPTVGEFVHLGWRMQGLCYSCNGTDKFQVDVVAAAKALGDGYSTRDFMLAQMCQKCRRRLSLYNWSPEELRDHARHWWRNARTLRALALAALAASKHSGVAIPN